MVLVSKTAQQGQSWPPITGTPLSPSHPDN